MILKKYVVVYKNRFTFFNSIRMAICVLCAFASLIIVGCSYALWSSLLGKLLLIKVVLERQRQRYILISFVFIVLHLHYFVNL